MNSNVNLRALYNFIINSTGNSKQINFVVVALCVFVFDFVFDFASISALAPFFLLHSDPGGMGDGESGPCGNPTGGGNTGVGGTTGGTTPFLLTWNGKKYVYENDFLFGKPQTAFASKNLALQSYKKGISGDIYVLKNPINTVDGKIKMQIKEIEPEESYIDTFSVGYVDLTEDESLVASAHLDELYLVDKSDVSIPKQRTLKYSERKNTFAEAVCTSSTWQGVGKEEALQPNDELIIQIKGSDITKEDSLFLYLESNFRDWTLGEQVPFSTYEQFLIGSRALGRGVLTGVAGVSMLGVAVFGFNNLVQQDANLLSILSVPHASADVPHTGGCNSLVVSAQFGKEILYLQTLFPRFFHHTGEILKIPKHIVEKAKGCLLTVRVKATKKHVVRTAYIASGKTESAQAKPLTLTKAYHRREQKDYTKLLLKKDKTFMRLEPADVVDIEFTAEKIAGSRAKREYVLQTNGFYTRLSLATKWKVGDSWYKKLDIESQNILKRLRTNKYV